MRLGFVLDEHFRGTLWRAAMSHNARGVDLLDIVRVGDVPDLPRETPDRDILRWAEREGRIIVTNDRRTMPGHLAEHLRAGHHSPGVFVVRPLSPLPQIVEALVLVASVSDPAEWRDQIAYIPF